jgi:hypothetical protein
MNARDWTVMDLHDLRQLAEEGTSEFWCPSEADRFFKVHEFWPKASVVNDPKGSAMHLAFNAQSIGLTASYQPILPDTSVGEMWSVTATEGSVEALEELGRIEKERNEAWNASREEDKAMWSDVGDILSDSFNGDDLVADIAGDLSTRSVGEVVDEWIEKAITEAETAIVNLIVEA